MWPFSSIPSVSPADAAQKLQAPNTVLIDVRTPGEYASGHAKGAQNFPLDALDASHMEQLKNFAEVYVMCRSGGRSSAATAHLVSAGILAINISGGLMAWHAAGLPME